MSLESGSRQTKYQVKSDIYERDQCVRTLALACLRAVGKYSCVSDRVTESGVFFSPYETVAGPNETVAGRHSLIH